MGLESILQSDFKTFYVSLCQPGQFIKLKGNKDIWGR